MSFLREMANQIILNWRYPMCAVDFDHISQFGQPSKGLSKIYKVRILIPFQLSSYRDLSLRFSSPFSFWEKRLSSTQQQWLEFSVWCCSVPNFVFLLWRSVVKLMWLDLLTQSEPGADWIQSKIVCPFYSSFRHNPRHSISPLASLPSP
jgi:hypothetical protein